MLVQKRRTALEAELNRHFPANDHSLLNRVLRYALFPGGKRIRPLLCMSAYRACGGRSMKTIMPFACGLELIHTFSLIQDDLPAMDNDQERRGKPCLHLAFGEATALLASDALFSYAFELFAGRAQATDARHLTNRLAAIRELALAAGRTGIVKGQLLDIQAQTGRVPDCRFVRRSLFRHDIPAATLARTNSARLKQTHLLKTARLISAALKIGAIIAGAQPQLTQGLSRAGTELGMLFQITDDLLDETTESATGLTGPRIHGKKKTQALAHHYFNSYRAELDRLSRHLTLGGLIELQATGAYVLARTT